MNAQTPSPMKTPDLAGLLQRSGNQPHHHRAGKETTHQENGAPTESESIKRASDSTTGDRTSDPSDTGQNTSKPSSDGQAPQKPRAYQYPQTPLSEREYLRSIMLYLPRTLHKRLHDRAADERTTATALILNAVNATHDRLGETLARTTGSHHSKRRPGDLFAVPQERRTLEPRVQTTIRVTDAQYEALADLTAAHNVKRSKLIVAALGEYLPIASEDITNAPR